MNLQAWVNHVLSDDRLIANLVAIHLIIGVLLIVGVVLRKLLTHGGDQFARWTGLHWLDGFSKEATRKIRNGLFWVILLAMTGTLVAGIGYHISGRDMRQDIREWYTHLTGAEVLHMGIALAELVILGVAVHFAFRLIRRFKNPLQVKAMQVLPHGAAADLDQSPAAAPSP